MNFILRLIGTGLGLWVSAKIVPGIVITQGTTLTETVIMLGLIALVFTIVNSIVRPLVSILAFPLYVLTFGLFALVTNGIGFMVASGNYRRDYHRCCLFAFRKPDWSIQEGLILPSHTSRHSAGIKDIGTRLRRIGDT